MFEEFKFMQLAINEAQKAMKKNNVPVGCVLIKDNKIISKAHNATFWHAEILCIQRAQKKIGKYLNQTTMFVTVEPCPMCLHAMKLAHVEKVFIGCHNNNEILAQIEIIECVFEEQCISLMKNFFNKIRNK